MMVLRQIPILDQVLESHTAELGEDFIAYRNHTYRVVNFCAAFSTGGSAQVEKIAVAAAFHDLGIWTDHTFDYLAPSVRLARAHLVASGREDWASDVTEMILKHHKLSRYRGNQLIDQFRCADWVDVSKGFLRFGIAREDVNKVFSAWPDAGFHKRLVSLALDRLRTHPWSPLPMVRL